MEMIEVFDENNNSLNYSVTRDEVHEKNLWHRHVSGWIMNYEGKILLQQRAFTKKKNPGMWSKTGGHVDSGETPKDAVKREVFEEIGLVIEDKDIIETGIFKSEDPNSHYFSYGYLFLTNLKEHEFILQKEEVEQVKYFEIEELEQAKRNKDNKYTFNKWEDEDFFSQMNYLKDYRNKIIK